MPPITKDQFVAILDEAGVNEEQKRRFHAAFEKRYPDAHQAFLAWLGTPADQIAEIRAWSRG